ncbi:MAG: FtsX-like permease family protein [Deltaproteobacteria bacterium]|nr:FtsX-like permease family protein [Deltaproteobacteria bacterium]
MNLAYKDIRHNLSRFGLTAFGIGMLLMIVMGMVGIYRGMIQDATLLIDRIGADLWIVQNGTRGPFAEVSRVSKSLLDRVAVVSGVVSAREFVYHTVQREHLGKPLRMSVLGLSWPVDKGEWLPLVKGRALAQSHFEMILDEKLRIPLGETLRLGKENYTVVGVTKGMIASGGDGLAFVSVNDAQTIQFDTPGEAVRVERASRYARASRADIANSQPTLIERALGPSSSIPALGPPTLSAVIVTLAPGTDLASVLSIMSAWSDVSVFTTEEQRQLMLTGTVEMARKQIGLFTALLTFISAIIMALILYTLTLEKLHEIALLKLIGASNRVILSMILQQALFLAAVGYGVAYVLGQRIFPKFPRRVLLLEDDLLTLAAIVFVISVLASTLGIYRAVRVDPNEALSG